MRNFRNFGNFWAAESNILHGIKIFDFRKFKMNQFLNFAWFTLDSNPVLQLKPREQIKKLV